MPFQHFFLSRYFTVNKLFYFNVLINQICKHVSQVMLNQTINKIKNFLPKFVAFSWFLMNNQICTFSWTYLVVNECNVPQLLTFWFHFSQILKVNTTSLCFWRHRTWIFLCIVCCIQFKYFQASKLKLIGQSNHKSFLNNFSAATHLFFLH